MESFEFLGGRYNRPEQIMSGPMQAFRAQNAATGRTVFIHRVSTTEAPEEQATLLKLLTTALVKSADAKRLVLDFGEERGYWYVVTESEPQCALLREWLQLEIDAAAAAAGLGVPKPSSASPITTKLASAPAQPDAGSGEFTRFLSTRSPVTPATSRHIVPPPASRPAVSQPAVPPVVPSTQATPPTKPQYTDQITPEATPQNPPQPPPQTRQKPDAGEFTRMFQSSGNAPAATPVVPAAQATPPTTPQGPSQSLSQNPAQGPSQNPAQGPPQTRQEPGSGEFTRMFQSSGNAPVATPVVPPAQATPQRPSQNPAQTRQEPGSGEFTRMIQGSASAPAVPPATPTLQGPAALHEPVVPQMPPVIPAQPLPQAPGEFTSFFNAGASERRPTPQPQRPAVSTPNQFTPHTLPPQQGAPSTPGPGEFTSFFKGGLPDAKPVPNVPSGVNLTERPQNTPPVQRPFTPAAAAPPPAKPQEIGEFTQLFSRPANAPPVLRPNNARNDPYNFSKDIAGPGKDAADDLFNPKINIPSPLPSSQPAQSEFTQLFGSGGKTTPPVQSPAVVAQQRQKSPLDDISNLTQPVSAIKPQPPPSEPAAQGPSDFTRMMQGAPKPPAIPAVPLPKIPTPPAMPVPPAGGGNKKLVIFFSVLGVLAVLLVALMMFVLKK